MYICEFCNNEYGTKKSLILHQKTAKFCLKIQKENENHTNNHNRENIDFKCDYCEDSFSLKHVLERHYETCKSRQRKIKEENEQKKDELIFKLQTELHILMTQTYPERERVFLEIHAKLKEELNECKTENLVLKKELNMKDDIISKLEKENESLKNKVDNTYMTLIEHSDKTYNTFFEK